MIDMLPPPTTTRAAYEYPAENVALMLDPQWGEAVPVLSHWHIDAVKNVLRLGTTLGPDWDTYGSPAPTGTVLNGSIALLAYIARLGFDDFQAPAVVPVSGGGVQFEWTADSRELELTLFPDASVEFLKILDAAPLEEGLLRQPAQLSSLFSWLAAGRLTV